MNHLNDELLQALMEKHGIGNELALAKQADVPLYQIYRLQCGLIHTFPVATAVKLAQCFDLSVEEFLGTFLPIAIHPLKLATPAIAPASELTALNEDIAVKSDEITELQADRRAKVARISQLQTEISDLKAEYQRLQNNIDDQRHQQQQEWQQAALDTLETWLLQWSAAAAAASSNPQFPAKTLVTLAQPVNDLLEQWGVEAIGTVGEMVDYDPQLHQLMTTGEELEPGDPVKVQNVGYKQGDRLLHRVKVIAQE